MASLDERMGGSVRAALDTGRHLVDRGEEVLVVATADDDDRHTYLAEDYRSVPYRLFPRRWPRHNFRAPAMRRWLRRSVGEFDVVELHGVFSFVPVYASWACFRTKTPYTVRPHGSLDPFDLRKHALAKRVYGNLVVRPLLSRASCVVLTSEEESERLETYGARPRRRVIPLPIEAPALSGDGVAFRRHHGIPEDALVVLFLGRIDHKKGLQFLIPALAALKPAYPRLWFLVAGDGDDGARGLVDRLVDEHRMSEWTTRTGFVAGARKQSAFAAADIFALVSLNENLGIAIVEAMHTGVPVLISDEVYIHRQLVERGAATVCEPSTNSCTAALRPLLDDPQLRALQATRGRAAAHELFEPSVVIPALVELYRAVAENR